MADSAIHVRGLRELERAFKLADREEQKQLRATLKETAAPVKRAAEGKAIGRIRNMPKSPKWAVMRIGLAKNVVYMVPKQKGSHGRGPTRRSNLKDLLLDRAMIPARVEQEANVVRGIEQMLDTVGQKWEQA